MSKETMDFEYNLNQYLKVIMPAIKALECLEANEVDPSDVLLFWHAFTQAICDVMSAPKAGYPASVQKEIKDILHARYNEMFTVDGRIGNVGYLATAYLHPSYLNSDLFIDEMTATSAEKLPGIRHPNIFEDVGAYLFDISVKEIMYGNKPAFIRWKGRAQEFKAQFRKEFLEYARQQYPFNIPILDNKKPMAALEWWQSLINTPAAQILPHIAAKLFSIRANSMADERTVSAFTWISPALRNRLKVNTMIAMTQVAQYHRTAREAAAAARSKSTRRPSVKYSGLKKSVPSRNAEEDVNDEPVWLDEPADIFPSPDVLIILDPRINTRSSLVTSFLSDETRESSDDDNVDISDLPFATPASEDDNDFENLSW